MKHCSSLNALITCHSRVECGTNAQLNCFVPSEFVVVFIVLMVNCICQVFLKSLWFCCCCCCCLFIQTKNSALWNVVCLYSEGGAYYLKSVSEFRELAHIHRYRHTVVPFSWHFTAFTLSCTAFSYSVLSSWLLGTLLHGTFFQCF